MLKVVPTAPETGAHAPSDDDVLRWALAYLRHAPLSLTRAMHGSPDWFAQPGRVPLGPFASTRHVKGRLER